MVRLRLRFYHWLRRLAKVPDSEWGPKWLRIVYRLLFPFEEIKRRLLMLKWANEKTIEYLIRSAQS